MVYHYTNLTGGVKSTMTWIARRSDQSDPENLKELYLAPLLACASDDWDYAKQSNSHGVGFRDGTKSI